MQVGVFVPINNNGWLISESAPPRGQPFLRSGVAGLFRQSRGPIVRPAVKG